MRFLIITCILTIITAANEVVVLDNDNFKTELSKYEFSVINFCAPWSSHCKKLAPIWEDLAKEKGDKHLIGKVDCTINSGLCTDVKSYPSVKFYRKDVPDDDQFEGERELELIRQWVDNKVKGFISDVVEFQSLGELQKALTENDALFVFFYAPWCGWCKNIKPVVEKVGTYFNTKPNPNKLLIAKIDASANNGIVANKYNIKSFPTFHLLRWKKVTQFPSVGKDLSRTFDQFVEWLSPRRGPQSNLLSSKSEYESWAADASFPRFIAYVKPNSKEQEKWITLVETGIIDDFARAHVTFPSKRKFGFAYIIGPKGKEKKSFDLKGPEDFKQFAIKYGYPYGEILTDALQRAHVTTGVPLFVGFFNGTPTDEQLQPFRDAAESISGRMLSGWTDDVSLASKWGPSGTKFPTATVIRGLDSSPYFVAFDEDKEEWTSESLVNYVSQAETDTYPRYIRSEPIPETQGPVTVLVGNNFESIVFDETKDVLIEFYAPWCGHCKKLIPIWDELGELFQPIRDVVIAKIDATANTLPRGVDASSFPTIMWFPKKNKKPPTVYSQPRTLESLRSFVLSSASRKNINLEKETVAYKAKIAKENTKIDL